MRSSQVAESTLRASLIFSEACGNIEALFIILLLEDGLRDSSKKCTKLEQLLALIGVLLGVAHASAETSSSHSVSFTYPQDNSPPNVRPPVYRGPSRRSGSIF
jgi:hypothetical protein